METRILHPGRMLAMGPTPIYKKRKECCNGLSAWEWKGESWVGCEIMKLYVSMKRSSPNNNSSKENNCFPLFGQFPISLDVYGHLALNAVTCRPRVNPRGGARRSTNT